MSRKKKQKSDRQVFSEQSSAQVTTAGSGETVWLPTPPEPEVFRSGYARIEELTDEQVLETVAHFAPLTCPFPGHPSMGDKDPEVVAWYRDNAPEEFERRYANRVICHQMFPAPSRVERGPVSDFDDEPDELKKPKVIM
jgi:hypothetical protein